MNTRNPRRRVKGFTIVEMIVVVAIIGILLGVLAPSMMAYIRRSRIKAANANAKMVYNAAQTEVQRYINVDRAKGTKTFDLSDTGVANNALWISYKGGSTTSKQFMTAAIPATGAPTATYVNADSTTTRGAASLSVIDNVNKTVSGASDICWAVCVQNYIVKGAVAADFGTARYIGSYSANNTKETEMNAAAYDTAYPTVLSNAVGAYGS